MKIRILILATFIFSLESWAYSSKRCHSGNPYVGTVAMTSSSAQFTSSWGPCSMFGSRDQVRAEFLIVSSYQIETEIAQGRGEYVSALSRLYGCGANEDGALGSILQINYSKIYSGADLSPDIVQSRIAELISLDSELRNACSL